MYKKVGLLAAGSIMAIQWSSSVLAQENPQGAEPGVTKVEVIGRLIGRGEARANSVIDKEIILQQPAGLDPLKLLNRIPGLQVGSSDALTGSFSMRLSMRGLNKEQIGVSIDGIPNGSTLSNGGTMPTRLLDTANLVRIDASQTAGDLGTPSNQALGGFIDFRTRDPAKVRGGDAEVSVGSFGYHREFVRYDTGKFENGLSAYGDLSHSYVRTWPGDQSGRSRRDHADLRILQEFDGGSSLRATVSYNDMADNDYDAVALTALSAPFYKNNFQTNPATDGLTDKWTGDPAIDQNYRGTRGINSRELFAHVDWTYKFGETSKLTVKPYMHTMNGNGWFYVPYKQLPANGQVYSVVPDAGKPVKTVQECYANQYQKNAKGELIPVAAVTFPTGVTAASLKVAGCPAAAKYAMNAKNIWGAREATSRRSDNEINRKGFVSELSTNIGDSHTLRFGGWYEDIDRKKVRNWFQVTDPTASSAFDESSLYSVTQDRRYKSKTTMAYLQDKMNLLNDTLELDVGVTYQRFNETYKSAVEFNGTRELTVSSGLLPKLAALYRLGNDWELFASASKNFSAIPDSVFEGTAAVDSKNGIKPETSINKDAGIRWIKGNYGLSLSVYKIDYRDRISIQNGNPNGDIFSRDATTTFQNQGGISSSGAEISGRAGFGNIELTGNYSYNDAHYVSDTVAEGIKAGDPVLGAAKHNAFVEVSWKPSQTWRLATNAKYIGESAGTYNVVPNTVITGGPAAYPREYMPAYTLVGLSASYRPSGSMMGMSKFELGFNVENLFDKKYLSGVGSELTTSNPLTSGRYFLGSPRTMFFTVRAHM